MTHDPYRVPYLYDLEYADQEDDIDYYIKLARAHQGPMLELACGNGRISLPIAKSGKRIHGVDCSAAMLKDLHLKRARQRPEVQRLLSASPGDFETLNAESVWANDQARSLYSLIILPFNAIHHCLNTDAVRALLKGIKAHLAPGGTFALDGYLVDPDLITRDPNERHEPRVFIHPKTQQTISSWERGWWDAPAQTYNVIYTYVQPDGHEDHTHLKLRIFDKDELFGLFEEAGFKRKALHSSFEGAPFRAGSIKWVLQLQGPTDRG